MSKSTIRFQKKKRAVVLAIARLRTPNLNYSRQYNTDNFPAPYLSAEGERMYPTSHHGKVHCIMKPPHSVVTVPNKIDSWTVFDLIA
jgi:hypothetical protein